MKTSAWRQPLQYTQISGAPYWRYQGAVLSISYTVLRKIQSLIKRRMHCCSTSRLRKIVALVLLFRKCNLRLTVSRTAFTLSMISMRNTSHRKKLNHLACPVSWDAIERNLMASVPMNPIYNLTLSPTTPLTVHISYWDFVPWQTFSELYWANSIQSISIV